MHERVIEMTANTIEAPSSDTETQADSARSVPFWVALSASTGLLVLLAVTLVLAIQLWASHRNTLQLLNEKARRTVERLDAALSAHVDASVSHADSLRRAIESGAVELSDKKRVADLLVGSLAAAPQIWATGVFDAAHYEVKVRHRTDGGLSISEQDWSDDPEIWEVAAELAAAEKPFWGEVFMSHTRDIVINFRQPLRRDGQFLGFIYNAITVEELSDFVTHIGDVFGGTGFVLYGNRKVLAHPNLTSRHPDQSKDNPLVGLNDVGDLVLANLWRSEPVVGMDLTDGSDIRVMEADVGGQRYIYMYRWTRAYGDVPWLVGAWFTVADLDDQFLRLWRSGVAGVGILLIAIVATAIIGLLIARPIRRLAAGAAKVSQLELEQVDRMSPSPIREIDEQARAFNAMLSGLRSFETYVPRALVTRMLRRGGEQELRSEDREVTIMFTDVVGFTAMSEERPAHEVAEFLNDHFRLLGACIEAEGGTVDKFIGDAIMAFWGAPEAQPDSAARACRAALAIARVLEADNAQRTIEGRPTVRIRIGINTGSVVVGNVGWPGRINYTIVGDTVNTTQRLEASGKQLDRGDSATILVSGTTAAQLDRSFTLEPAGSLEVKGKEKKIEAFRLIG